MTAPPEELNALVEHVLARLQAATADAVAPWRTPMLASISSIGLPALRTVVLRAVRPGLRQLRINTDRRSAKAAEIAAHPAVQLGFWDPGAREQLRVSGSATVDADGAEVEALWAALPSAGRAIYRGGPGSAPGLPIPGGSAVDFRPLDPGGGNRDAFAVITVTWTSWDWVWLGETAHRRAGLAWSAKGFEGSWRVP